MNIRKDRFWRLAAPAEVRSSLELAANETVARKLEPATVAALASVAQVSPGIYGD